jgi:pyruvate carboxylase
LLVANRGEIAIRVFRSASELGIRTVAIYSHEDRFALHRFKADEAYQVGAAGEPIKVYLNIPAIIELCLEHGVDAIHPGYGFLSENPELARACNAAGIRFVGPRVDVLENLGDKIAARSLAEKAQVPVLPGSGEPLTDPAKALPLAEKLGYPVLLKAAKGGGGRGMRLVKSPDELPGQLEQAMRESQTAFGSPDVFLEKFITKPRHIEVQLLGDTHGNLVHLYERDCSLQRRHQKVVELAPAPSLDPATRDAICEAALKIGREVNYSAAGTVEFLLDAETDKFYFIEVNPRIQVEHTVTEAVTGIDLVRSQILVAQGHKLSDPELDLADQSKIVTWGFAIQCRVTTEDPENGFRPDYGHIEHYRSPGGMGVRLDAGTAFSGALVTPYYDSLLVKATVWGRTFSTTARRMERTLQEFRIRGVKTNIPFLLNVLKHPDFLAGGYTTRFLDEHPELFQFTPRLDRATKLFRYLGELMVNGHPLAKGLRAKDVRKDPAPVPEFDPVAPIPDGTRQKLKQLGPEGFAKWTREHKPLLFTDTTFRDAHQSLLATRFRTYDLLQVAGAYARLMPQMYSLEMWGGATFDTTMRFLQESPWQRLVDMRAAVPNILFQMLLRASNAVGYSNYPDNVVNVFCEEAAQAGMDIFRIFDPLNSTPNMRVAMEAVLKTDALCEASICYTGDLMNPGRPKYDLKYYVSMGKELERMGAHILAIKDMAGLCKPYAAEKLVKALRDEVGIPVHFHTHDTAGIQAASILKAADAGVDVVDAAIASMSGLTSQPNLNSLVEALRFTDRETELDSQKLRAFERYWEAARELYAPFESGQKSSTAEVYHHEMPGGQVTNLYQQAAAVGLANRWPEVCDRYAEVNQLFGDIVKVTPTSKAVGDMALFLVSNNMSVEDVLTTERDLAYPASVMDLMAGRMGFPNEGFPADVQAKILGGEKPVEGRPGESMPPADFEETAAGLEKILGTTPDRQETVTYLLYPKVYRDFINAQDMYGDVSVLPTRMFFYGMEAGEEQAVEIEKGKTLIVKYITTGDPDAKGRRTVFFELNGQPRNVTVVDKSLEGVGAARLKADTSDPKHASAPMPGMVSTVAVRAGDAVAKGQKLFTLEAMKMETTVTANVDGTVADVYATTGTQVEAGDLIVRIQ